MSSPSSATDVDEAAGPVAAPATRLISFLSLFTSFGTLICCALPALLVLFGLGAAVASILSVAPWLVWLSRQKAWVFAGVGGLIALNAAYLYAVAPRLRLLNATCPPGEPSACGTADRTSRTLLWWSGAIYSVGFFTAFLLGPMLEWWAP